MFKRKMCERKRHASMSMSEDEFKAGKTKNNYFRMHMRNWKKGDIFRPKNKDSCTFGVGTKATITKVTPDYIHFKIEKRGG